MNLTTFTDYSLRTLIYVATQPRGRLSTIAEIARVYHISENHLTKSVHKLGKLGLLETVRGKGGGFRLAKPAEEINIGWIVRQMEEKWNIVECFDENSACILRMDCRLQHILRQALQSYLQVLDQYTLADITTNHNQLTQLFTSRLDAQGE